MPTLKVKDQKGSERASVELNPAVFAVEPNAVLVREVYNSFMTNQRQGTHSTKTRHFVSGGGKKPWKQKHTGRARQGSIRAHQWRHGATCFGPLPKDYREKVNRKKLAGALRSLLTAKHNNGEVHVVDSVQLGDSPKTKQVVSFVNAFAAKGRTLIVTKEKNEGLVRAARNLGASESTPTRVEVVNAVTIFDLLASTNVIFTQDALAALQERLAK